MPMMSPHHAATTARFADEARAALDAIDILDAAAAKVLYTWHPIAQLDILRKIARARRHLECTPRAFINWAEGSARIEIAILAREKDKE